MNLMNIAFLLIVLNGYVLSLPMNKQTVQPGSSPRYELVSPQQVERYRDREYELASLASSKETNHVRQMKARSKDKFAIKSYHRDEINQANNDIHAHMNNVNRLDEAKHTGAVKVTRSASGRKDIYTAITTNHYHQHQPKPSSSTSHV